MSTAARDRDGQGPLSIERQGSFFVGGRLLTAAGRYDAAAGRQPRDNAGQSFWVDQMYVHYQLPVGATQLPLVLVHGGGCTGAVWESTPDGREGFQSLLLRRGHPVYVVDAPRGGRSGFPSFTGAFGRLDDDQQAVPPITTTTGREHAWTRWRMGTRYPDPFPVQAFPIDAFDQLMRQVRPRVSDDAEVASGALEELIDRIGPAILVTHSNSGLWGWLAAARHQKVRAVVSYEPTVVFPGQEMPPPVPLFHGSQEAGSPVTEEDFLALARIPIQVVFGDNIPQRPVPELPADGRRAQVESALGFAQALNRRGGRASVLRLPDVGLRGNSHFPFIDLNNVEVADLVSSFIAQHGLHSDRRSAPGEAGPD